MKKCIFRIWAVIGGLLMATAVSAQKNLSDYSIVDNCTPEAVGWLNSYSNQALRSPL